MPITIYKKTAGAPPPRPAAEIVPDAPKAELAQPQRTAEKILEEWERIPPPHAKPIVCKWCKKPYLQPSCHFDKTEAEHFGCMNFRAYEANQGRVFERIDKDAKA